MKFFFPYRVLTVSSLVIMLLLKGSTVARSFQFSRLISGRARNGLKWEHYQEIADALYAKHYNVDPLTVKFTELHKMIIDITEFKDDPEKSSEGKLEKIQMEWLDLFSDH